MKSKHNLLRHAGSIAGRILALLAEDERHGGYSFRFPWMYRSGPLMEQYESEIADWMHQADLRRAIKDLERKKLVHIRKIGDKIGLVLTDIGRQAGRIEAMITAPPRADGKKLLVSFDVPERVKGRREQLVRFLKRIGLKRMHASLWATTKDIRTPLAELVSFMKAEKWIRLYEASEVEID